MRRFMGEEKRRKGGRTKDSLDFFGLGLLDERVEEDDVFALCMRIWLSAELARNKHYPHVPKEDQRSTRSSASSASTHQSRTGA